MMGTITRGIVGVRNGKPAVNVKDRRVWAHDAQAGPLIEKISDERVQAIYEQLQGDFWRGRTAGIVQEFGYGTEAYAEGRSGGWLVPSDPPDFLDYIDIDSRDDQSMYQAEEDEHFREAIRERDRFLDFARRIAALQEEMGEHFLARLREEAEEFDAEHEVMDRRRQALTELCDHFGISLGRIDAAMVPRYVLVTEVRGGRHQTHTLQSVHSLKQASETAESLFDEREPVCVFDLDGPGKGDLPARHALADVRVVVSFNGVPS